MAKECFRSDACKTNGCVDRKGSYLSMMICALLSLWSLFESHKYLFEDFAYSDVRDYVEMSILPNFTSLLIASGSDKYSRHHYERYYERWLEPYRYVPGVKVLEIGADQGHSLKLWEDYFADPEIILGLKYGNDAIGVEKKIVNLTKVSLYTGDQFSKDTMDNLNQQGPWHIIIDDGSHVPAHVMYSFTHLWGSVASGGMYVVEDLETSYWPHGSQIYGYPLQHTGIFADANHSAAASIMQLQHILVRHQIGARGMSIFPGDDTICSIEWGMNLLAIRKCGLPTDGPGPEFLPKIFNAAEMSTWLKEARSTVLKD